MPRSGSFLVAGEARLHPLARSLDAGRWFAPGETHVCILSRRQADAFGIGAADLGRAAVRFLGGSYAAIGIAEQARFEARQDLEGSPLMPLDREAQQPTEEKVGRARPGMEAGLVRLGGGDLLLLPAQIVARWGEDSRLAGMAVRLEGSADASLDQVEDLAEQLGLDLSAAAGGRRYLVSAVGVQSFSGQSVIWVPLLVGAVLPSWAVAGGCVASLARLALSPLPWHW